MAVQSSHSYVPLGLNFGANAAGNKRSFGDIEDDEDDFFGSDKVNFLCF